MSGWISESSVLRLVTVFLVFSAALNRSKRRNLQWIINASVIATAVSLYSASEGLHGLLVGLSGAGAAALLAIPLYRSGWMTRIDIFTTCAIGMHMGPVGFAIAYGIAVSFIAIQHILRARTTLMTDYLFRRTPFYPMAPYRGIIRPSLVEMESHRMLDDDSREGAPFGEAGAMYPGGSAVQFAPVRDEVLPWPFKIALATIVVLISGISS